MKKFCSLAGLAVLLFPLLALAWWNDDWSSRRQINVDTTAAGGDVGGDLADFPLLLRLHAGNFGFFADLAENGRDLRFLQDDKTPLAYQIEQVDVLGELGLVWIGLPQLKANSAANAMWMYYGNPAAADAGDGKAVYSAAQGLVYHFQVGENLPQDATAYATHAAASGAAIQAAGWIGAAAQFTGAAPLVVNAAPQLAVNPQQGWTFSCWLRLDQPQNAALLLDAASADAGLKLAVQGTALTAGWHAGGTGADLPPAALTPGRWQHLALVFRDGRLTLYLDGAAVADAAAPLAGFTPALNIGAGLTGLVDEVTVAATARSADWIKLAYRSQSPDFTVLDFGQDESNGGGDGHFLVIVQNVTPDGWVVIGLTMLMLVVAVMVMVGKSLVVRRTERDNALFLAAYRDIDFRRLDMLDREESSDERELADSPLLTALAGDHDHYQSSPLYHLYHLAVHELRRLQGDVDGPLTPEAWHYLRVKLDARIVQENQRLNANMVLLTIAIAGGPFLGLLGTVIGVMITFASIAATGDVNINAIAPGIAAALLATVAGLAVAIPSLFAYNYLLTRLKAVSAGMRVFTDEFLALLSMRIASSSQEPTR